MLPLNVKPVKPSQQHDLSPADLISGITSGLALALAQAAHIAAAQGAQLWLIGGVVRDLLLGLPLKRDVDLALEGDTLDFSTALATALGGHIQAIHHEFGTATLSIPCANSASGMLTLDIARARIEAYSQPAMLPIVQPASIVEDLRRRDFSVNAIALELLADGNQLRAGDLLDPFGGRDDLAEKRLRLLHAQSLRDDPTRLLRGFRLAARMGLTPDAITTAQIADALAQGYLSMLTPERILGELCLALDEPHPDAALALADAWGVTPQIVPGLAWSEALVERLHRRQATNDKQQAADDRSRIAPATLLCVGLLCYDMAPAAIVELTRRYPLPAAVSRMLAEISALREVSRTLNPNLRPSQIDSLLRNYSDMSISVLQYAQTEPARQIVARYLNKIRPARPLLDGRDIQELGIAPGPAIGRMLAALRAAYLDGEITTREQAKQWVRARMKAE